MDRSNHAEDDDTIGLDAEIEPHPEPPWPERVTVERPAEGLLGYREDPRIYEREEGKQRSRTGLVVTNVAAGLVSKGGGLPRMVREVAQIAAERCRALARLREALEQGDNNAALAAAAELAGVQHPTR